ncbi:50S ribosomal protein L16 [bacterium]|nr:50S ribosomal protein L16 [bacterium]
MLQPKKTKYRKMQKGRMKGHETRGVDFEFGSYALRALEPGWITSRQIEAARRAMTREIKRGGNVWIKIFPDKPITAKPAETRMGSGKGNLEYWVAVVKPNRILFELEYFDRNTAVHALELAAQKLPIKVKVVEKNPVQ